MTGGREVGLALPGLDQNKTAAAIEAAAVLLKLVAGARFELTTFRL